MAFLPHLDKELYTLTQSYLKIVRERDVEVFDPWLTKCLACGIPGVLKAS